MIQTVTWKQVSAILGLDVSDSRSGFHPKKAILPGCFGLHNWRFYYFVQFTTFYYFLLCILYGKTSKLFWKILENQVEK